MERGESAINNIRDSIRLEPGEIDWENGPAPTLVGLSGLREAALGGR